VSNVSAGSVLVNQAGTTMAEVVNSVRSVTEIVKNFHRAVQQQSDGITQVNRAVTEMQSVARQNAALVESMSQASDTLRAQGAQLMSAVDLFQLGQNELAPSPSRA
jgi:methyl-accepting chemotaxis protein